MTYFGKSIREQGEMSFWAHLQGVAADLSHVRHWIEWDDVVSAAKELMYLVMVLATIAAFPVSLPTIAFTRMKAARKILKRELDRQERIKRMQSRVQKV